MSEIFLILKDYAAISVACLAAAVSVVNLAWSTRLTERRERRKILWEREFARFGDLEEITGCLVEDLLRFKVRTEDDRERALEKLNFLRSAAGRFLRYKQVAAALRDLEQAAGWYIAQDMRHDTRAEFEKSKSEVSDGFERLLRACDTVLRTAPSGL